MKNQQKCVLIKLNLFCFEQIQRFDMMRALVTVNGLFDGWLFCLLLLVLAASPGGLFFVHDGKRLWLL
jgi:hypothetical protein